MFHETIVWLDALYIAKKPLPVVFLPLRDIEYRRCATPFFDSSGLGLPLRAILYPPGLFTAKSFCLVEQLIELNKGRPDMGIFMKKSGAKMRESCWYCEYDSESTTCQTPLNETNVYARTPAKTGRPPTTRTPASVTPSNVDNLSNTDEDLEPDFDSGDEKPDDLSLCFADDEEWAFRSSGQNPLTENAERVRMPPHGISAMDGLIVGIVGESKYYFAVNSLTAIVTVRSKHSERCLK